VSELFALCDVAKGDDFKAVFVEIPNATAIRVGGGVVKSSSSGAQCPNCAVFTPSKNVGVFVTIDVGQSSSQSIFHNFSLSHSNSSEASIACEMMIMITLRFMMGITLYAYRTGMP
jgi:cellulase/cellobiase CelA1